MVKEHKIKDPMLQELFDRHHISWRVDRAEDGFPRINVIFPSAKELPLDKTTCPCCNKTAEIVMLNPTQSRINLAVYMRYFNLRTWKIEGCRMEVIYHENKDAYARMLEDYTDEVDSVGAWMYEKCTRGTDPGIPLATLQTRINSYFGNKLAAADIKMRPPLVSSVRAALMG